MTRARQACRRESSRPPLASLALALVALAVAAPARATDGGLDDAARDAGWGDGAARDGAHDPLASLRRSRALLEGLADGAPLVDDDALRRALGVDDLRRATLRERANALRVQRRDLAFARADGGVVDEGRDGGARALDTGERRDDLALIDDALAVVRMLVARDERAEADRARVRAEESARALARAALLRAEEAQRRAREEAERAHTARLEILLAATAEVARIGADVARARSVILDDASALMTTLATREDDARRLRERALSAGDDDKAALFAEALEQERALLTLERDVRARTKDRLAPIDAAAKEALVSPRERKQAVVLDDERDSLARLEAIIAKTRGEQKELGRLAAREDTRLTRRILEIAVVVDDVRLLLIKTAPSSLRRELYGLSELGVENLTVSLTHAWARVRVHMSARAVALTHVDETRASVVTLGRFLLSLGWSLLWLVAAVVVWRRAPVLWPKARAAISRRATTREAARVVAITLDVLETVSSRLFLIVVVLSLADATRDVAPEPETSIAVEIALWILAYQLVARLTHFVILRLTRAHVALTPATRLAVLRSVQLVWRVLFIATATLGFVRDLVGDGVLYVGVRAAFALLLVPTSIVLLVRWREPIVAHYRAHWPSARLAERLAANEQGAMRTALAAVALFFVAANGLAVFGRDFALGFEQTRKALAYLFRLRIERQAKARVRAPFDATLLPRPLIEACDEGPLDSSTGLIGSRVASAEEEAELALRMRRGRSVLVSAMVGVGLSTWMRALERAARAQSAKIAVFRPTARLTTQEGLVHALAESIDGERSASDVDALVARMLERDLDLVTVDGLEWLFLRELDGFRALDALLEIVRRTRHRVSYVLGASTTTVDYLTHVRHLDEQVTYRRVLPAWSEEDIRALLLDRKRRSGLKVSYDELLVHGIDIASTEVVETEDGYTRLLWNFAGGNPRLAQHFFLRSLVPKSAHEVTVRLYEAPSPDDLELLPEGERFMLFSTVLHRCLTHEQIARACRVPIGSVDAHVGRGLDLGFYREHDDGAVSVTTAWTLAVNRYLRRKNLW